MKYFVTIRGLNNRLISVDAAQVQWLEEHRIDELLVTNIHFTNGKWTTAGLSLNETFACLSYEPSEDEKEKKEEKEQLSRWRMMAKSRAEAQREIDEALRHVGTDLRHKSYHKEEFPDGSGKLVVHYEPRKEDPKENDD
jgi:hypothetical protein